MEFTQEEKNGVERHFKVKWDELTELGQMFKGLVYRHTLSPKAIADQIMGPASSSEVAPGRPPNCS